jgi:hypothetical protein
MMEEKKRLILEPVDYEINRDFLTLNGISRLKNFKTAPSATWVPLCFGDYHENMSQCKECPVKDECRKRNELVKYDDWPS